MAGGVNNRLPTDSRSAFDARFFQNDSDPVLAKLRPDAVPFAENCVRSRQVYLVDGSAYFSCPGLRLVDSLESSPTPFAHRSSPCRPNLPRPAD